MSTPSMSRFAALMLSIPLLITAGSSLAQTEGEALPSNENRPNNEDIERERPPFRETEERNEIESDEITLLKQRIQKLEEAQSTASAGMLGIPYPLLVTGGSGVIGLIALALSITALIRNEKQRAAVNELSRRNQTLSTRIGGVEVQIDLERIENKERIAQAERTSSQIRTTPTATLIPQAIRPAEPTPPAQATPEPLAPAAVSKAGLISALNSRDRQQLREASTSELNITSDSENAIATGRSITTELEVVPGGGSYWLVMLHGQAWLFPTERTLNGFAAAQPAKGLFHYQQQTIAKPQLIEPAALEGSGDRWSVKSMGLIGTP